MSRWNNNLENNSRDVMVKAIKNIKPEVHQQLLVEILNLNIDNNKKLIEQFLRTRLGLSKTLAKHTKNYWLLRGWNDDESYVKSKENKQKNCSSVYSKEHWLRKINPDTSTHYTPDEAERERNSRRPIRKEYWMKKGYAETEAIKLASDTKNKNNKKGANSMKSSSVRRITSKRCIEYYIARGHSSDDANAMLSENQKFFSKEICIAKYGDVKGLDVWQKRQDRWLATLNSKSEEERARINRAKMSKGIKISKAEKIIVERLLAIGVQADTQFSLFRDNKKQYVYDIVYNKKIIEYNGDFWHSNPACYPEDYINPRTKLLAKDKWALDEKKLQCASEQGYEILVIWERDFKQNQREIINQCLQFLTQ